MRLDKFLSESGVGSRSEVKQFIKKGFIQVNGKNITQADYKVQEIKDCVVYQGQVILYEPFIYYVFHKPSGVVSATKDNVYETILDVIDVPRKEELFPVGRLDVDTEGLLLLTNDGALSHNLLSPKKHVTKVYEVHVSGIVGETEIQLFKAGIELDEFITKPAKLEVCSLNEDGSSYVKVSIMEGKFHQVKRMFLAVEMEVLYLKRVQMGALCLPYDLTKGSIRKITKEEVLNGLEEQN